MHDLVVICYHFTINQFVFVFLFKINFHQSAQRFLFFAFMLHISTLVKQSKASHQNTYQ
jgi:hypothetical protein